MNNLNSEVGRICWRNLVLEMIFCVHFMCIYLMTLSFCQFAIDMSSKVVTFLCLTKKKDLALSYFTYVFDMEFTGLTKMNFTHQNIDVYGDTFPATYMIRQTIANFLRLLAFTIRILVHSFSIEVTWLLSFPVEFK